MTGLSHLAGDVVTINTRDHYYNIMTTPSCLLGYPELSRSPALSANQRPGLGESDQSEAAVPGCCLARAGSNYLAGGAGTGGHGAQCTPGLRTDPDTLGR